MSGLGGIVKIGKIMDETKFSENDSKFFSIFSFENLIDKYLVKKTGKINIGLSLYEGGGGQNYLGKLSGIMKDINKEIKDNLKKNDLNCRFLPVKDRFLPSATVEKNNILTKGAEIVMVLTAEGIKIGKTEAIQEFEQFAYRDFYRPAKDKRSGIMPPKLARILINLTGAGENAVLIDPFCGSGTILQEAILLEFKNIIGSDISAKAISDTKKNMEWLSQYYLPKKAAYNLRLLEADVKLISGKIPSGYVDAIATEPYLGPPLLRAPDLRTINRIRQEVGLLLISAFREFQKIMKPGGVIVIIFPAFENGRVFYLDILNQLENFGFDRENLLEFDSSKLGTEYNTERKSLLYGGREQFVKREILKFRKKR